VGTIGYNRTQVSQLCYTNPLKGLSSMGSLGQN
jgi:hypothetical protein